MTVITVRVLMIIVTAVDVQLLVCFHQDKITCGNVPAVLLLNSCPYSPFTKQTLRSSFSTAN